MTNGYIVLTKGEPNLYKHAVEAITLGKPIYYADGNKVAFVNSIELVSTDVVIKTSDKQITVKADGTESENSTKLKALRFDLDNLTLVDASYDANEYFTIITSLPITKLSELSRGEYAVLQGTILNNSKERAILSIEINENIMYLNLADDDSIAFTITTDADGIELNI